MVLEKKFEGENVLDKLKKYYLNYSIPLNKNMKL